LCLSLFFFVGLLLYCFSCYTAAAAAAAALGPNVNTCSSSSLNLHKVLYESHTVVHGRPFPLDGSYFANVFVHFEVIDEKSGTPKNQGSSESLVFPPLPHHDANRYRRLRGGLEEKTPTLSSPSLITPRLLRGTPQPGEGAKYTHHHHDHGDHNDNGHSTKEDEELEKEMLKTEEAKALAKGSTSLHLAAAKGDLQGVQKYISEGKDVVVGDTNHWHPIHEVACFL
jgi:prolyl 4-hydroxylase